MTLIRTILPAGLTLVVLTLIATVAGAFVSPTQTPPGGNVSPPVTTEGDQTITGLKTFDPAGNLPFTLGKAYQTITNLDADKVDAYDSADLLAATGGGNAGGTLITWGQGSNSPGSGAPVCPSGYTESYAGYGPFGFNGIISSGSISESVALTYNVCATTATLKSGAGGGGAQNISATDLGAVTYNTCRVCVPQEQGGAATQAADGSTILYSTAIGYNGNLGGRPGADSICASELPGALTGKVTNTKALLSVTSGDEIRDLFKNDVDGDGMAGPYESQLPIYAYNRGWGKFTKVDSTWQELLDGSILASLDNTRSINTGFAYWTGAPSNTANGSLGLSCNSWTNGTTETTGGIGSSTQTGPQWLGAGTFSCSAISALICAAKYTP